MVVGRNSLGVTSHPSTGQLITYTDNFLIISLKESSSPISGSLQPSNRWPIGEGERGGSSAPAGLRDLTRIGMLTSQLRC